MGFLKRFFRTPAQGGTRAPRASSFDLASDDELQRHLEVSRYGEFSLTEAIRPSFDLRVVPREGFRHDSYYDEITRDEVPVLLAAASSEKLFDVFLGLLDALGDQVDVVLETSHHRDRHEDLFREHIDLPVLKSTLYDFEELLLDDGCSGIAVLNAEVPLEVQFDEHKLLIVYGHDLSEFEECLRDAGLRCDEQMKFITEAEHVHSSCEKYFDQFEQLRMRLGVEGAGALDRVEDDDDGLYA